MNNLTNKIVKGLFAFAALGAALISTGANAGYYYSQQVYEYQVRYHTVYVPISCHWVDFGSHARHICE